MPDLHGGVEPQSPGLFGIRTSSRHQRGPDPVRSPHSRVDGQPPAHPPPDVRPVGGRPGPNATEQFAIRTTSLENDRPRIIVPVITIGSGKEPLFTHKDKLTKPPVVPQPFSPRNQEPRSAQKRRNQISHATTSPSPPTEQDTRTANTASGNRTMNAAPGNRTVNTAPTKSTAQLEGRRQRLDR
jgi:hypothetical protein